MGSVKGAWQTNGPLAIFTPCSNSHPFDERRIPVTRSEDQAVKVGRAVVRLQPAPNNAIFDCKVLSRNHAIMWYEDEQFLIKDTRSSNGTFVNNDRLSNSGEESARRVLRSGDILQLGVEIVDNAKKVASGCVTCIVRLINERGEECMDTRSSSIAPIPILMRNEQIRSEWKYTLVKNDKLFIMDQYVKEARFRENLLGQKLQSLEEQLASAQEALQSSWQALINEEQLLSRIEILESQLALISTKNPNNEELRQEIQGIYEDRAKSEIAAKDSLRKAEEQVYETTMRLHDAENGLVNIEEENQFLRCRCQEYEEQFIKHREEYDDLQSKYNDALAISASAASVSNEQKQERGGKTEQSPVTTNTEFKVSRVDENDLVEGGEKHGVAEENPDSINENIPLKTYSSKNGPVEELKKQLTLYLSKMLNQEKCMESKRIGDLIKDMLVKLDASTPYANLEETTHKGEVSDIMEPNVSFIGESNNGILESEKICVCGRELGTREVKQSSSEVQVLFLSIFPFAVLIMLLLFPIFFFWPAQNNDEQLDRQKKDDHHAELKME